jgi:hypothetical protein
MDFDHQPCDGGIFLLANHATTKFQTTSCGNGMFSITIFWSLAFQLLAFNCHLLVANCFITIFLVASFLMSHIMAITTHFGFFDSPLQLHINPK